MSELAVRKLKGESVRKRDRKKDGGEERDTHPVLTSAYLPWLTNRVCSVLCCEQWGPIDCDTSFFTFNSRKEVQWHRRRPRCGADHRHLSPTHTAQPDSPPEHHWRRIRFSVKTQNRDHVVLLPFCLNQKLYVQLIFLMTKNWQLTCWSTGQENYRLVSNIWRMYRSTERQVREKIQVILFMKSNSSSFFSVFKNRWEKRSTRIILPDNSNELFWI